MALIALRTPANDRICCGKCHIRTGTLFIAFIELLIIISSLIFAFYAILNRPEWPEPCDWKNAQDTPWCNQRKQDIATWEEEKWITIAIITANIIQLLIVLLLLAAILFTKPTLIIPHIVIQSITIAFLVITAVVLGLHGGVFGIVICCVIGLLQLFFIYIVFMCYRWLKHGIGGGATDHELRELRTDERPTAGSTEV